MEIKRVKINDPSHARVLADADQIILDYEQHGFGVINEDFARILMVAYKTMKRNHQEDHDGWLAEGYNTPCAWDYGE